MVKNPPANEGDTRDVSLIPGLRRSPEEEIAIHSSILAGESHGQRSLTSYSPKGHKESDTTEQLCLLISHESKSLPPVSKSTYFGISL